MTALKEPPTLLEVAAFAYFPGSFLVGPQFSMKRYLDYINGELMVDKTQAVSSTKILINHLSFAVQTVLRAGLHYTSYVH